MSEGIEKLFLNPVEFTPELPEISLEALGLTVAAEPGPDYGESSVTVERVRQDISEGVTDARWAPVERTIPLIARGGVDLAIADPLHRLEGWVADVQRRKTGWVRRDFSTDGGFAGSVAAYVDSAALTPAQGWSFAHMQFAPGIALKFTRYPIWFATVEVTEDAEGNPLEAKGSGVRDLQLELADLLGTAPGLITVRLKNEGTEDWRGCYVSLECDDFSDAPTALPKYEAAELTPKGGAELAAVASPPEVRAVGAVAAGVGAISPSLPAGTAAGDLLVMVCESGGTTAGGEAKTRVTAAGWAEAGSQESGGNTCLTLLWKIAAGGDATLTNDTGDHQLARIIGIKAGTFDPRTPFNVTGLGSSTKSKAVSIPGATTTRDNCLVIACASAGLPDSNTTTEFSGATNAGLTGLTERIDNTTAEGDGGAIWAVTGVLPAHGTFAATTGTAVTESDRAMVSVAVNAVPAAVRCPPLTAGWVTVLESPIGGTEHMTHVGPRRMIFRIDDVSTTLGDVQWKLEWRTLGAATWNQTMVTSTPLVVSSPVVGNYQLLDLGEARPEVPVTGDPRFQWRLQGRSLSSGGKQPLIRDVYPMSTEQWSRVSDASAVTVDGEQVKPPATIEESSAVGTVAWTNQSNAAAPGGGAAEIVLGANEVSHYLKALNFGFALPEGASVLWINVTTHRRCAIGPNVITDSHVRIIKGGVIKETVDRARELLYPNGERTTFDDWIRSEELLSTATYGGDLWGQTWTAADINSATFGIALAVTTGSKGATGFLDSIAITVAYSEGGNENRICFAGRSMRFADLGVSRQHVTEEVWGDVPAPEGVLLKAPAPGQAGQDARLLVVPSVGDLASRADSASVKVAAKGSYRPGYLHAREAV